MDSKKALWDHMTCEGFLGIDEAQLRCRCAQLPQHFLPTLGSAFVLEYKLLAVALH